MIEMIQIAVYLTGAIMSYIVLMMRERHRFNKGNTKAVVMEYHLDNMKPIVFMVSALWFFFIPLIIFIYLILGVFKVLRKFTLILDSIAEKLIPLKGDKE